MDSELPLANRIAPLQSSVFAILVKRMAGYQGKRYPFHIGDNALRPPESAEYQHSDPARFGDPYRYGHPAGEMELRTALAQRAVTAHCHSGAGPDNIQVTVGATHAISCALQALLDPGDQVLLLSPYWPLVRGISHCSGVQPIDVPFYQRILDDQEQYSGAGCRSAVASLIEPYITSRTRAIYVISPNNPNGLILSEAQSIAIAAVAEKHDLWLIDDRAYESYVYDGKSTALASIASMAARTVTTYTFSKTFAMAGTRIGYAVGPERVIAAMRRVATHSVYNPAQVCQSAAWAALENADRFLSQAVESYRTRAALVAELLTSVPFYPAQGGSFVFLDLRSLGTNAMPVLERAADKGVTLAPGAIFGQGYEGFARLCFTATSIGDLREGLQILDAVIRS